MAILNYHRDLKWSLRKTKLSSPLNTVELLMRYKQEKWTNYPDGSTTLDEQLVFPWSTFLIKVTDFNNLEEFLSSTLWNVLGLRPDEIPAMAARIAAEFDNVATGISVVVEIEVGDEYGGNLDQESEDMIFQDAVLSAEENMDGDLGVCNMCDQKIKVDVEPVGKLLPCRHFFHDSCILDWTSEHGHCPLCEFEIVVVRRNIITPRRGLHS